MEKKKIAVTTDCVCDLPLETLKEYDIDIIPFHIVTESGRFCDMSEITSDNILEYISNGHKAISVPSSEEEYRAFFEKKLERCEKIIHITLTSGMSHAHINALKAAEAFDGSVIAFDSRHLSTGMGHLVIKAAILAREGEQAEKIIDCLTDMRRRVSTSFMAYSAEYLYLNGKIGRLAASVCKALEVHPILSVTKDGRLSFGGIQFGNYERPAKRYIKKLLNNRTDIDRTCLFITHAGCPTQFLSMIKKETEKYNIADRIEITNASATVSSNCGPNTFGLLFVKKEG